MHRKDWIKHKFFPGCFGASSDTDINNNNMYKSKNKCENNDKINESRASTLLENA